jgi:hypothetical protein
MNESLCLEKRINSAAANHLVVLQHAKRKNNIPDPGGELVSGRVIWIQAGFAGGLST